MTRGTNRLWDAPLPTGYRVGPVLTAPPAPTPRGKLIRPPDAAEEAVALIVTDPFGDWTRDPRLNDGHPHRWETVLLGPPRRVEEVVRCEICHAPRCGSSTDRDPCMLRRHHRREHVLLFGTSRRLGTS